MYMPDLMTFWEKIFNILKLINHEYLEYVRKLLQINKDTMRTRFKMVKEQD